MCCFHRMSCQTLISESVMYAGMFPHICHTDVAGTSHAHAVSINKDRGLPRIGALRQPSTASFALFVVRARVGLTTCCGEFLVPWCVLIYRMVERVCGLQYIDGMLDVAMRQRLVGAQVSCNVGCSCCVSMKFVLLTVWLCLPCVCSRTGHRRHHI